MQDLNDMVLFAEVIEHHGFSAASRVTGIPKSRISRRIAGLEKQLGLQLMHRSSRKLSLTPDGEVFLRYCRDMREAARTAFEAVAQGQSEPRGTVKISCPVTLAQTELAPALPRFMEKFPQVQVDVHAVNRPVDPIVEGVDLAIRVRTRIEDSAVLVAKTFGSSHSVLVISPALLSKHSPVTTPEELARFDTIAMSIGDGRTSWELVGPDGQSVIHIHTPRYIADDLQMLIQAATQGSGLALLPEYLCRKELQEGRLVKVLPGWGAAPGIVHLVYPVRRTLVPAVRQLVDFLQETFQDFKN